MRGWVLLTRGEEHAAEIRPPLASRGLEVVALPVLREVAYEDEAAWTAVVGRLEAVSVLALTSPRAVAPLARGAARRQLRDTLAELPVAAVGEATASTAQAVGLHPTVVGTAGAAELADLILAEWGPDSLVLHACGRERRPELRDRLALAGATVLELPVYAVDLAPAADLPQLPEAPPVAVVLSSPRAVEGYVAAVGGRFAAVPHLAFGRNTAAVASRHGITQVTVTGAGTPSIVEEICQIC